MLFVRSFRQLFDLNCDVVSVREEVVGQPPPHVLQQALLVHSRSNAKTGENPAVLERVVLVGWCAGMIEQPLARVLVNRDPELRGLSPKFLIQVCGPARSREVERFDTIIKEIDGTSFGIIEEASNASWTCFSQGRMPLPAV